MWTTEIILKFLGGIFFRYKEAREINYNIFLLKPPYQTHYFNMELI